MLKTGTRLSIFPLPGALLLPRSFLPLHIFEPRYRAMVSDSLARDRRIAMIQPLPSPAGDEEVPALFDVGCLGRIAQVEALTDGRFNLILEGVTRFRVLREIKTTTPFRQIEGDLEAFNDEASETISLSSVVRGEIEREARIYADVRGYEIDWDALSRLDDETLVNGLTQALPFDIATKQALLEAETVYDRADLIAEFLRFGAADDQTIQ